MNLPGVLCESFDTNRNGVPGFQWSRLPVGIDPNDPLRAIGDPNDDVLGYTMSGGLAPLGTASKICSDDDHGYVGCQAPVATENDWHLHSAFEGPGPGFGTSATVPLAQAHSGVRSMHMGRHLDAGNTLMDVLRFRQVSAFVLDSQGDPDLPGLVPGPASTLEFWHMISVPDDEVWGNGFIDPGTSFGGGQLQISLMAGDGRFERWQRLTPIQNGYDSIIQETLSVCGFDPGDDAIAPANETMCGNSPLWADLGDFYGSDPTCVNDTNGNDPEHKDCGAICGCTPGPGCTELGSIPPSFGYHWGVWARSTFNMSPFAGRVTRLRWIGMMEGGWSFATFRSSLEPDPGSPAYNYYDFDDGWYIDDIKITDLRQAPDPCVATDDDGDGFDECERDCDDANPAVYPGNQVCGDGINNDCNDLDWPLNPMDDGADDDLDGFSECEQDCDDANPAVYPGAPELCDGIRNDCSAPWIAEDDSDHDGHRVCEDCNDVIPTGWAIPSAIVLDLSYDLLTSTTTLMWSQPAAPGATSVRYDVLRSQVAQDFYFGSVDCLVTNGSWNTMEETPIIPLPFLSFYLVRTQNICSATMNGGLGNRSDGTPRVGRACEP